MYLFSKRTILFLITFSLGLIFAKFFFIDKTSNQSQAVERKIVLNKSRNRIIEKENCISVQPKLNKLDKIFLLNKLYEKVGKQENEIRFWLQQNEDSSLEIKRIKEEEIENLKNTQKSITKEISEIDRTLTLEDFRKTKIIESQNLLYIENCTEF